VAQLLVSRGAIVDAAKVQHTGQAVCTHSGHTLDSQNLLLTGHAMFHPTRVCAVPWWHPGQRGDAPVHRIHERPRGGCDVPHRHGRCRPACPGEQRSGAKCARKCFQEELDEEDTGWGWGPGWVAVVVGKAVGLCRGVGAKAGEGVALEVGNHDGMCGRVWRSPM
jgi:hypothetical protein